MPSLWDNPEVPREDWRCMEVADVLKNGGVAEVLCEMCGTEKIRFVHVMDHDGFDETLAVCVACAERMTGDSVNPRLIENRVRRKGETGGKNDR